MTTVADRITALSDPTRRVIFEIVATAPHSVVELARKVPVSRPAVSQHLRVLKDAGMVTVRVEGRRHFYQLDPHGVTALRAYLDALWDQALAEFKAVAERPMTQKKERRP